MTYIRLYKRDDIINSLKVRARAFPRMMDDQDLDDLLQNSIRRLDETANSPRDLILTSTTNRVDLRSYGVDDIVHVFFSQEAAFAPVGSEVGLLPLILRGSSVYNFQSVTDFLIMKSTLNIMNRQLRTAPDYEYKDGILTFNRNFGAADVEYLPYFDAQAKELELYQLEYDYLFNRTWIEMNLRNAEAILSGVLLGVGKEALPVVQHWQDKLEKLDAAWEKKGVISFVG